VLLAGCSRAELRAGCGSEGWSACREAADPRALFSLLAVPLAAAPVLFLAWRRGVLRQVCSEPITSLGEHLGVELQARHVAPEVQRSSAEHAGREGREEAEGQEERDVGNAGGSSAEAQTEAGACTALPTDSDASREAGESPLAPPATRDQARSGHNVREDRGERGEESSSNVV